LPAQADRLPFADALRDAHIQGPAVDADPHAVAGMHRFQRHRELGAGVGAGPRATTETRLRPTGPTPPAAEQALEEITEASAGPTPGEDLLEVDTPGRAAKTTRRRLDVVAGTIAAGTQLVVGSAFLRVAQRLVGLVDGLEALLGVRLLADVGVE